MFIVITVNYVVADGQSNWLEGMILICLYIIIVSYFDLLVQPELLLTGLSIGDCIMVLSWKVNTQVMYAV